MAGVWPWCTAGAWPMYGHGVRPVHSQCMPHSAKYMSHTRRNKWRVGNRTLEGCTTQLEHGGAHGTTPRSRPSTGEQGEWKRGTLRALGTAPHRAYPQHRRAGGMEEEDTTSICARRRARARRGRARHHIARTTLGARHRRRHKAALGGQPRALGGHYPIGTRRRLPRATRSTIVHNRAQSCTRTPNARQPRP